MCNIGDVLSITKDFKAKDVLIDLKTLGDVVKCR